MDVKLHVPDEMACKPLLGKQRTAPKCANTSATIFWKFHTGVEGRSCVKERLPLYQKQHVQHGGQPYGAHVKQGSTL